MHKPSADSVTVCNPRHNRLIEDGNKFERPLPGQGPTISSPKGRLSNSEKNVLPRGLNRNHNPRLKQVFKSAALTALRRETVKAYHQRLIDYGARPELARVSVARKPAAIKREFFDSTLSIFRVREAGFYKSCISDAGVFQRRDFKRRLKTQADCGNCKGLF